MAGAMEAIAPDFVFLIIFIREAVQIGLLRHGLMKGRIKDRHHRHARHDLHAGTDTDQVGRIVQRRQIAAFFDSPHHLFINQYRAGEALSSVHHAMSHRADLGQGSDDALLLVRQFFDYQLHRSGMIRHIRNFLYFFSARLLMGDVASVNADPLAQTLGQNFFRIAVDELIFQRRTSAVDYQYFHPLYTSSHPVAINMLCPNIPFSLPDGRSRHICPKSAPVQTACSGWLQRIFP